MSKYRNVAFVSGQNDRKRILLNCDMLDFTKQLINGNEIHDIFHLWPKMQALVLISTDETRK
jgi:hypothetical protein